MTARRFLHVIVAGLLVALAACAQRSAPDQHAPDAEAAIESPVADANPSQDSFDQPPRAPGLDPPDDVAVAEDPPPAEPPVNVDEAPGAPVILRPFPHIEVHVEAGEVRFDGIACLDIGWLEQVACSPQTREHESLIVTPARPSDLHAALLAAGFEPGAPGKWSYENDVVSVSPPTGAPVRVEVLYVDRSGATVREPIGTWIRDHRGLHEFPDDQWIFGGSRMRKAPAAMGGGEVYEADHTGSVIGLVTFGDEVLGWSNVLADQEAVHAPEWEVNTAHVPTPGTPVTVILSRADEPETAD